MRDLVTDPNDFAIVSAILAIARQLRIDVVAEGIEGYQQAQKLQTLGCRYGQGFLFAKPATAENSVEFLKNSKFADQGDPDAMVELIDDSELHDITAVQRSARKA